MVKPNRKLIDMAVNAWGDTVVKYEYTESFDSSVVGKQEVKTRVGEWEKPQSLSEALRNDKSITNK